MLAREPELFAQMVHDVLPLAMPNIDAVAVTHGPGLEPALWIGINFAKALSFLWNKPLVPINHMEGHIYSALLVRKNSKRKVRNPKQIKNIKSEVSNHFEFRISNFELPTVALLVSGGHTELVLVKKLGSYAIIGETLDDAAGEAFDKVAHMLKQPYPGGPAIARLAKNGDADAIAFPRPMLGAANFHFSFSGLKTAVLYYLRAHPRARSADVAASFQAAAIDVLAAKTLRAIKKFRARTLLLGGGVAANTELRTALARTVKGIASIHFPDSSLTGDNALMIAAAAFFRKQKPPANVRAEGSLRLAG